jgi:hypothetical protein
MTASQLVEFEPPPGCTFHPRCPDAGPRCRVMVPRDVRDGELLVACLRHGGRGGRKPSHKRTYACSTFHRFFGMCVLMKTPRAIKTKRSNFSKIRQSNNRQICKRENLKVQSRDTISQICQLRACRVESRKLSNIWTMKSRCDQAAQCSPPPLPSSSIKRLIYIQTLPDGSPLS